MGKFVSSKSELDSSSILSFDYAAAQWRYRFYVLSDGKTADQWILSSNCCLPSREAILIYRRDNDLHYLNKYAMQLVRRFYKSHNFSRSYRDSNLAQSMAMFICLNRCRGVYLSEEFDRVVRRINIH